MLIPDLSNADLTRDGILDMNLIAKTDRFKPFGGTCSDSEGITTGYKKLGLRLELRNPELGPFNSLVLDIANLGQDSALVGLNLTHACRRDDQSTQDSCFTGGREFLDKKTRRKLHFPLESFGFYGASPDWINVRHLEIFVILDRDQISLNPITVRVFGLYGVKRLIPRGPRLKPSGLSKVLRSDVTGLTSFKPPGHTAPLFYEDVSKRDLITPFTFMDESHSVLAPHHYPVDSVETVLEGVIMGEPVPGKLDWLHNPWRAHEWTHFLNRHHFLRPLAVKTATTGCPRCVLFLDRTLSDWIVSNPVPLISNGGAGPTWETLTIAWRLREWFWIVGLVWSNPEFSSETRLKMLRSIWEHAQSLMDHQGHPNNWIIVESSALAITGLLFPHFHEAENWVETGSSRIYKQLEKQFFDDGTHFEISLLYHAICLNSILEFRSAALFRSLDVPKELDSTILKASRFLRSIRRPDGTWPSINDSGSSNSDFSALMGRLDMVLGKKFEADGSKQSVDVSGEPIFEKYGDSGLGIMRSGNGRHANYMVFRSGPAGAAHAHADNLSIEVSFNGHRGLIDPGITEYAPGPLSDYYRSARSHSVALVDDVEPDRTSAPFQNRISQNKFNFITAKLRTMIIAHGSCRKEEFQKVKHFHMSRTVVFVKGLFWIIRDFVTGEGLHKVSTLWKCRPCDVRVEESSGRVTLSDSDGLHFQIFPVGNRSEMACRFFSGAKEPTNGWSSVGGKDVPSPLIEYVLNSRLPKTLFWGLFPVGASERFPPEVNLRPLSDGKTEITAHHGDSDQSKIIMEAFENFTLTEIERNLSNMVSLDKN